MFETGKFSPEGISRTAETLGCRYQDLAARSSAGDCKTPFFEGLFGFQFLPCGVSLFTSDLKSLRDDTLAGQAERSFTIALPLESTATDYSAVLDKRLHTVPHMGSIISVADSVPIETQYRYGQRSRSLSMRTRPEDIADDAVAERVEALLRLTSISPMSMSRRVMLLAEELISPSSHGVVGRLLAESCALELLAQALLAIERRDEGAPPLLSRRDHVKVRLIRDMMLADPTADFTLRGLAREAGMSMTILKTKFSAVFGQSVISFLRDVRLHHAKEGLEREGWTVSQAAHFVGYKHHSNFSTAFRRKYGAPPKQFRKG